MTTVIEDLPLERAKAPGIYNATGTDPAVGPGSYNADYQHSVLHLQAPFNSSSQRKPLSESDAVVPGPGAYSPQEAETGLGIASCPFLSDALRFSYTNTGYPGPGAYYAADKWPTKRNARSHKFKLVHDRYPHISEPPIDGGYYYPNYSSLNRGNPRVSNFGRYSEREKPKFNENPGPGSYSVDSKPHNLYSSKPSSMFATNTSRSGVPSSDAPGPGSYDIPALFTHKPQSETFSAFGSAQSRFVNRDSTVPGPGHYTGDIAPRRPKPADGLTAAFASNSNRFQDSQRPTPGPGAYKGNRLPKRISHGGVAPFGSTVTRFHSHHNEMPGADGYPPNSVLRIPQRIPGHPIAVRREQQGSDMDATATIPRHDEGTFSNVGKPTSTMKTTFGGAPRLTGDIHAAEYPGPGTYDSNISSFKPGGHSGWNQEVRFPLSGSYGPGPGEYHHNSTFLKQSHNRTIQFDTTWQ